MKPLRREARWRKAKFYLPIAVPAALFLSSPWLGNLLPASTGMRLVGVSAVAVVVGIWMAVHRYSEPAMAAYATYHARFKQDVVAQVFKAVCPTATYSPYRGIARDVFNAPGLFTTRGLYRSDDQVRGQVGATRFEAAEVRQRYTISGERRREIVVFDGLFIYLDFNKAFRGRTLVHPKRFLQRAGRARQPDTGDSRSPGVLR